MNKYPVHGFMFSLINSKEHRLFFKYRKCEFWWRSVVFLGYIICNEGVEFDPRKTDLKKNSPRALDPMDIRSFLALEGFLDVLPTSFHPMHPL